MLWKLLNRRLVFIVFLTAVFVQGEYYLEYIIYNELKGLSSIDIGLSYVVNVVYSFIHFSLIFLLDILLIRRIDKWVPWQQKFYARMFIEFALTSLCAIMITIPLTIIVNHGLIVPLFSLPNDGLTITVYYNILYIVAINTIFVITYEAVYMYGERKQLQLDWSESQKEKVIAQFEALKNQVNPHFLFNSMNSLSTLIKNDSSAAIDFTHRFSSVFRYALEIKDNLVVTLREELEFARAYVVLQQTRYPETLIVKNTIDQNVEDLFLPPFSLQLLIENAIKHNVIASNQPLYIDLWSSEGNLFVKNNLQTKALKEESHGVGVANLKKRYALITERQLIFDNDGKDFTVKIPLLKESEIS